jgi:hypothetical protein
LVFVLRLGVLVAAVDEFDESNKGDGYDSGVTEEEQIDDNSTIDGGAYAASSNGVRMDQEISELCNSDMSSFLPPPYKNISNMICRPVWNTFLLRVSFEGLSFFYLFVSIHGYGLVSSSCACSITRKKIM